MADGVKEPLQRGVEPPGEVGMGSVERRVATWVDLTGDLINQASIAFPHRLLSACLHETFGCQVTWNWLDPDGSTGFLLHEPIPNWPSPESTQDFAATIEHHPVLRWYRVMGDMAAMTIGRVPSALITEQGRALQREHFVPIGMDQQMSISYRLASHHYRAFNLGRSGKDFSDEDLRVARQLQPLLRLLDRQRSVLAREVHGHASSLGLTGRELAVLQLLAEGLTAASIGHRLGISIRTVHRHLQTVYRKLKVSNRVRAVVVARESGLVPSGDRPASAHPAQLAASADSSTSAAGLVIGDRVPIA